MVRALSGLAIQNGPAMVTFLPSCWKAGRQQTCQHQCTFWALCVVVAGRGPLAAGGSNDIVSHDQIERNNRDDTVARVASAVDVTVVILWLCWQLRRNQLRMRGVADAREEGTGDGDGDDGAERTDDGEKPVRVQRPTRQTRRPKSTPGAQSLASGLSSDEAMYDMPGNKQDEEEDTSPVLPAWTGGPLSLTDVRQMFQKADTDGQRYLTFDELRVFLRDDHKTEAPWTPALSTRDPTDDEVEAAVVAFENIVDEKTGCGGKRVSVHDIFRWLASNSRLHWKGMIVEPYHMHQRSWAPFLLAGPLQSIALPALILDHLGSRLVSPSVRAWLVGGGLITVLAVWAIVAPTWIAPISTEAAFCALGSWFMTLIGVLVMFVVSTSIDLEWTDIDDFMLHRVVRRNKKNLLAVASQFATMAQLMALAIRVLPKPDTQAIESPSSYQNFKIELQRVFDIALFQFDIVGADGIDFFVVSFLIAVVAVALWWVLFGGLLLHITMNVRDDTQSTQIRYQLYETLRRGAGSYYIFTALSDTFMISILSALLRTMDCSYDAAGVPTLDSKPEWVCWKADFENAILCDSSSGCEHLDHEWQPTLATVSLVLILFYTLSATLLAPYVVADSDGIFQPEQLDVRFSARFLLAERTAKLVLTACTIFFGTGYPWVVLLAQFNAFVFLWFYAETTKPCSILWVNVVRSATFGASAVTSFCVLLDVNTNVEWAPFILNFVGLVAVMLKNGKRIKAVIRHGGQANLVVHVDTAQQQQSLGTEAALQDSQEFDDSASLRGFSHRLASVSLSVALHRSETHPAQLVGLINEYEMDGVYLTTPRHAVPTDHLIAAGLNQVSTHTLHLVRDLNEQIILSRLLFLDDSRTIGAIGIEFVVATGENSAKTLENLLKLSGISIKRSNSGFQAKKFHPDLFGEFPTLGEGSLPSADKLDADIEANIDHVIQQLLQPLHAHIDEISSEIEHNLQDEFNEFSIPALQDRVRDSSLGKRMDALPQQSDEHDDHQGSAPSEEAYRCRLISIILGQKLAWLRSAALETKAALRSALLASAGGRYERCWGTPLRLSNANILPEQIEVSEVLIPQESKVVAFRGRIGRNAVLQLGCVLQRKSEVELMREGIRVFGTGRIQTLDMRIPANGSGKQVDSEGASALFFDVNAKKSLQIRGLTLGFKQTPVPVEIWAATSKARLCEVPLDDKNWKLVAQDIFTGSIKTAHKVGFPHPVTVSAGEWQAFYVFAQAEGGRRTFLCCGTRRGVTGSDDSLDVNSGQCGRQERWTTFGPNYAYELAGAIEYQRVQSVTGTTKSGKKRNSKVAPGP